MLLLAISPVWISRYTDNFEPAVQKSIDSAKHHLESREFDKAAKEFRQAIHTTKHKTDAYYTAILAFVQSPGRRAELCAVDFAREYLDQNDSGKLDKKLARYELCDLLMMHGQVCFHLGLKDEAFQAMERALKIYPNNPLICNDLGYLYADSDYNLRRSLQLTKIAVNAEPENAMYIDSLGWAYYKLGRYNDAVRELKKAVRLSPMEYEIRYHLGAAYAKLGMKIEALIELQKSLVLAPGYPVANELYMSLTTRVRPHPRKL